jgi:hypothetical protein
VFCDIVARETLPSRDSPPVPCGRRHARPERRSSAGRCDLSATLIDGCASAPQRAVGWPSAKILPCKQRRPGVLSASRHLIARPPNRSASCARVNGRHSSPQRRRADQHALFREARTPGGHPLARSRRRAGHRGAGAKLTGPCGRRATSDQNSSVASTTLEKNNLLDWQRSGWESPQAGEQRRRLLAGPASPPALSLLKTPSSPHLSMLWPNGGTAATTRRRCGYEPVFLHS